MTAVAGVADRVVPAESTAPAVQIVDLTVTIGGVRVVHGVDVEVGSGEWVTVIGPNGAGKSTMLRAIGGLLPADGQVTLFGTPLARLTRRSRARLVATVAQNPVVPAGVAVLDYTMLGRVPYQSMLGRESKADLEAVWSALDRLGLADFADRPLETLSGGERQRVFLAAVLAPEPRLLTHELVTAGEYADRLLLLAAGRVVASGAPNEVLTERLLAEHYGARVRVVTGEHGPIVVPVRSAQRGG